MAWKKALWGMVLALGCGASSAADDYTRTRHPVVLVHGMLGFDAIGAVDYFYGVPSALRRSGAVVYTPALSQVNSTEVRGEQLLLQLRTLQARYGHTKFNLIGHSHGGPTIRYVASVAPELVASATSVGAPHHGSPVSDKIEQFTSANGTTGLAAAVVNGLATLVATLSGHPANPQDALAVMHSLTTSGAADFNRRFPEGAPALPCGEGAVEVKGVRYYSMGGTSVSTNLLDPSDLLFALSALLLDGQASDGLVPRCSAHWGQVLRDDYAWNHLDQVNQAFGLRGWLAADPVAVYRAHANRLKNLGL